LSGGQRVSVVVPTFRRPDRLLDCLSALERQTRRPDEIIVVQREEDLETARALSPLLSDRLRSVTVKAPGVLAAMRKGAAASSGELLVFFDDDAEPRPDWLARASEAFHEESVGAFGGRDVVVMPDSAPRVPVAGIVTRWGKLIGEHHRVTGASRDVDVLKGANMAFRRQALALPRRLRGTGAEVHFEVATCLSASRAGWRLVLDPGAVVDHLPGPRFDADRRGAPAAKAIENAAYNLVFCLLSTRPDLTRRRVLYGLLVGDRAVPGLARVVLGVVRRESRVIRSFIPSVRGQLAALRDLRRGERVALWRPDEAED
jgi:glycosyltransferase involved in cell wall biosynthesis